MSTLHILKSKPDEFVEYLMERECEENDCQVRETFAPDVDWRELLEQIFLADKVICWW